MNKGKTKLSGLFGKRGVTFEKVELNLKDFQINEDSFALGKAEKEEKPLSIRLGIGNNNSILSEEQIKETEKIVILDAKDWHSKDDKIKYIYIKTNVGECIFNKNNGGIYNKTIPIAPDMRMVENLLLRKLNLRTKEDLMSWEDPVQKKKRSERKLRMA